MMIEIISPPAATAFKNYEFRKAADNRTTESVAEKFIGALTELESARDVEQLAALFAEDCEIGNVATSKKFGGSEGVRRFWTLYRRAFKDVCSIFRNEIYSGNQAKMQWTTTGVSRNNRKINYEGISVLEIKAGKIMHFYAFFDVRTWERQNNAALSQYRE